MEEEAPVLAKSSRTQTRILVVGKLTGRPALFREIARSGGNVLLATSEAEALQWISKQPVDALLYAVTGSGMQAARFLDRLRARQCDACVILAGPDLGAEQTASLLRAGAFDYLTVPVGPRRLRSALAQGLDVRRSFIQVRRLSDKLRATNEALAYERDALQRWNHNLVSVNRLNQSMAATLDADEIINLVRAQLKQLVPYKLLGVVWFHPERVWVDAPGVEHEPLIAGARRRLLDHGHRLSLVPEQPPRGIEETVGNRPHPDESGVLDAVLPSAAGATDVLEIPLVTSRTPLGLMRLECLPDRSFQPVDVELSKTLAMSLALALRNADAHSQLQNLAMTDGLTNLLNRRAFSNVLSRIVRESERYGTPVSLILADIDFFKRANDRHGHLAGDRVLREVADIIGQSLRTVDVAARYGGEEFAIILPRTDVTQAAILANRIRERVEQQVFDAQGAAFNMTISLGIARVPSAFIAKADDLIANADTALYRAKSLGRNRVEVMESPTALSQGRALSATSHALIAGSAAGR
jgi:diguanylate cyclase (GGDEF)-like protein